MRRGPMTLTVRLKARGAGVGRSDLGPATGRGRFLLARQKSQIPWNNVINRE